MLFCNAIDRFSVVAFLELFDWFPKGWVSLLWGNNNSLIPPNPSFSRSRRAKSACRAGTCAQRRVLHNSTSNFARILKSTDRISSIYLDHQILINKPPTHPPNPKTKSDRKTKRNTTICRKKQTKLVPPTWKAHCDYLPLR